jgi:hypothetical protein
MSYGIVHKNRVVVGPMAWSQKYFTSALKIRHKIDANIPGIEPEILPYVIDNDTKIHRVVENRPELNTMIHYYYGPIWDFSNDIIIANYEVKDISIEVAKDNFRSVLASERYKKEISNTKLTLQNLEITIDTSRERRNVYIQKFLTMNDGEVINWKFSEGWLTVSKEELGIIAKACADYIQDAFNWEKSINEQIDSCLTTEELLNLDFISTEKLLKLHFINKLV